MRRGDDPAIRIASGSRSGSESDNGRSVVGHLPTGHEWQRVDQLDAEYFAARNGAGFFRGGVCDPAEVASLIVKGDSLGSLAGNLSKIGREVAFDAAIE